MKLKFIHTLGAAAVLTTALLAGPVQAQVVTGTIPVSLTLTSACTIGTVLFTSGSAAGSITHDPMTFPSTPTTVTGDAATVTAHMSINYQCSAGSTPKLAFSGGTQPATPVRRMKHSAQSQYIPYRLYRATGGANEIPIDGTVDLSGTNISESVTIHGIAIIPANLNVGVYSDSVTVTLTL